MDLRPNLRAMGHHLPRNTMMITKKNNRAPRDLYPTPPAFTEVLFQNWQPDVSHIWEPACGEGHMVQVIQQRGYTCTGTDVSTGDDFLMFDHMIGQAIITNPPFSLTTEFAIHALSLSNKVALLLGVHFLGGSKRATNLWIQHPPAMVVIIPQRMQVQTTTGTDNSQFNHMWVVWDDAIERQSIRWTDLPRNTMR